MVVSRELVSPANPDHDPPALEILEWLRWELHPATKAVAVEFLDAKLTQDRDWVVLIAGPGVAQDGSEVLAILHSEGMRTQLVAFEVVRQ